MGRVDWHPEAFIEKVTKAAMDGAEEGGMTLWLSQARENCPVGQYPPGSGMVGGTMRASLGIERDDSLLTIFFGGGGAAAAYIYRQEKDRSLNHTVGKPGFIGDTFDEVLPGMIALIQQRVGQK